MSVYGVAAVGSPEPRETVKAKPVTAATTLEARNATNRVRATSIPLAKAARGSPPDARRLRPKAEARTGAQARKTAAGIRSGSGKTPIRPASAIIQSGARPPDIGRISRVSPERTRYEPSVAM